MRPKEIHAKLNRLYIALAVVGGLVFVGIVFQGERSVYEGTVTSTRSATKSDSPALISCAIRPGSRGPCLVINARALSEVYFSVYDHATKEAGYYQVWGELPEGADEVDEALGEISGIWRTAKPEDLQNLSCRYDKYRGCLEVRSASAFSESGKPIMGVRFYSVQDRRVVRHWYVEWQWYAVWALLPFLIWAGLHSLTRLAIWLLRIARWILEPMRSARSKGTLERPEEIDRQPRP